MQKRETKFLKFNSKLDKVFRQMLITAKLLVLANKKCSRIIVSCNTKTIAIITKLIAALLIKQQQLTTLK